MTDTLSKQTSGVSLVKEENLLNWTEVLEKLRRQFGLDKPIWKRYLIWLGLSEKEIEYKEGNHDEFNDSDDENSDKAVMCKNLDTKVRELADIFDENIR